MSISNSDAFNDQLYERVLNAKFNNPEMFISNWEEDNTDICSWTEKEILDDPKKQLITEAEFGHLEAIKNLIANVDVDINAEDNDGYRALHRACYNGHVETARFLISRGADVNAPTKLGWTALHSSVYWNQLECVELLLASGVAVNRTTEGGQTALHLASSKADVTTEILVLLLARPDIDVSLKNAQGDTAIDLAGRHTSHEHFFYPWLPCCTQLRE